MGGSATALVIVSVLLSMVVAAASAYLYGNRREGRGGRRRRRRDAMAEDANAALGDMMNTNNVVRGDIASTDSLDAYLDLTNVNGKSSDTIDYAYPDDERRGGGGGT